MPHPDQAVVTGTFSYTGRYITRRLLDEGIGVRTLTRHPDRQDPFVGLVQAAPLDFSDKDGCARRCKGPGFSTTPTEFGSGVGRPLLTGRWKTRRRCLKPLPRRASAG